jgi:putative hydrolase of the HAD superfamily
MAQRRFIFFDVGNTLLFPNRPLVLSPLATELHPTLDLWQACERRTKLQFDAAMMNGDASFGFWWRFHTLLLEELNISNDQVRDEIVENMRHSANWDHKLPDTRESLDRIGREYAIAVISNSDGKVAQVLQRCGIYDCFKSVTDSGVVGHEKPHPAIFEAALRAMNARPEESLYVGDVHSVDYVGATQSGMQAVLFDVVGAYREKEFPRVKSLGELESWLRE